MLNIAIYSLFAHIYKISGILSNNIFLSYMQKTRAIHCPHQQPTSGNITVFMIKPVLPPLPQNESSFLLLKLVTVLRLYFQTITHVKHTI